MQQRKAIRRDDPQGPRLERTGSVVRIRSLAAGRQLLRERHRTTQAGFTAEKIPKGFLKHHPILISDGPLHDEQRTKVGRFFAPKVVAERYPGLMADSADRLLAGVEGELLLDDLALLYSVEVTAKVVGLTESPVEKMAGRLTTFFNQPPFDITKPDLGRTGKQWAAAAVNGLVPVARFYVRDVRPAVRARRKEPRGDVISHLIAEGYTNADILIECVTYGTAGMVTTREFICMAAWHLLTDEDLRSRYEAGEERDRIAVLNEIIRLEPVVGHLYRRVQESFSIEDGSDSMNLEPGDLVDVCVRDANVDPEAVGSDALSLCPARNLPRGVDAAALTFGDGAHRCPGQPLALLEADALLTRLLALNPRIVSEPELGWDDLIAGYTLRGFRLALALNG
ncbi:cytochrome P450 [Tessaracoccus flavus]|uniref:cytochrome P450 n=1 Tax=Tessaracoccus flavus TaxID=1610493 RepID=UPI0008983BAD|nr:cytochrome P450 [Tessaracoccus flavus]SDY76250.1 Cytochrome P450 [Tessaracoccus flavus]